jgi:outer membrane lipoprotein-sorting protein
LLINSLYIKAQTVDEIIGKHIASVGGKDKLSAIKSIYMEGEIAIPNSPLGTAVSKTYIINGRGLREEILFKDLKQVEGYTNKGGWRTRQEQTETLNAALTKAGQVRLTIGGALLNYKENGCSVKLIGKENINNKDAYHIKLVTKDSLECNYWIDPENYYIAKMNIRSAGGEQLRSAQFSDYRKTPDGIMVPFASEFQIENSTVFYLVINKVEINKDIDPSLFELSKK